MQIKFIKTRDDAVVPTYGSAGAACFDFYALDTQSVRQGQATVFDTGIALEFEPGYGLFIFGRSGLAFNHGIRLVNAVAVIDADFRDSIKIGLTCDRPDFFANRMKIEAGNRIAQGCLLPLERAEFIAAEYLSGTERGTGGFGSSGL